MLVGILIGYSIPGTILNLVIRKDVLSTVKNCPYPYINQLRCEPDQTKFKKEYTVLRNDLMKYIREEKEAGHASFISVYFRDLQNGPTMSIDSSEDFAPASLLKVPLMITYYKKAQEDQELLSRKVVADGSLESLSQNITPEKRVTPGKEYTVDELIDYLVTQSDNTAWKVLLNYLRAKYTEQDFVDTLSDLGIIDPRKKTEIQYISVQNYASMFRTLYNAWYLNRDMSDKALSLLTHSGFKDGLVAGAPDDVEVAHKYGEVLIANTNEQQLHDCGIVYYPPNPYLICVMSKGDNIKELERVIADISAKVYNEVDDRN